MRRAALAIAIVLCVSGARAQDITTRTFSWRSASATACPAVTSFSARILARTSRAASVETGKAEIDFTLKVEVDSDGASGTLEIATGDARSVRTVRGASCEEAVEALALVAALVLDPNASTGSIETPPAPGPAVLAEPPAPAASNRANKPPPPMTSQAPVSLIGASNDERGPPWRIGAGIRAMMTQGLAPDPVLGFGAIVSALLDTESTPFEPLMTVGVAYARSGGYDARIGADRLGTARFEWIAAELSGCPIRFPRSGVVAARPCAGIEAGRLKGTGEATNDPAAETAPWLAATAALRLDWMLFDSLRLELAAGGFYTLRRDEFFFETGATSTSASRGVVVHEIPALGARAAFGIEVVLPGISK